LNLTCLQVRQLQSQSPPPSPSLLWVYLTGRSATEEEGGEEVIITDGGRDKFKDVDAIQI